MSRLHELFKRRPADEPMNELAVVAVPDIKQYLVREYERVAELKRQNEVLQQMLEETEEINLKYDAAMVTLDEYFKRLKNAEIEIQHEKDKAQRARNEAEKSRDVANSYRIKLNDAAITKEQMRDEIASEVKSEIIAKINAFKGNISKDKIVEMIRESGKEIATHLCSRRLNDEKVD